MKKVLCIVAVLLALSLVLIPAPTASAAGQEPGDIMTFTYSYSGIYGLSGEFSFEDPANIIEDLDIEVQTTFTNGSLQNNKPFYYSNKPEDITITVTFKISENAPHESYCNYKFEYDIADQYGNTELKVDSQRIVVYIPGLPTTPSTQPTQPTTQPTSPVRSPLSRLSRLLSLPSPLPDPLSPVPSLPSPVPSRLSPVRSPLSPVRSRLSPLPSPLSPSNPTNWTLLN